MQSRRFWPAICRRDLDQDIFDVALGVFDVHVKISMLREMSGIQQFELRRVSPSLGVLVQQPLVRVFPLSVLVQHAQITVRWRGIEIEVLLLYVLAMVSLVPRQSKEPFFEDSVFAIPHRQRKTDHLVAVADPPDSVFTPAIRSAVRMFKRKKLPGAASRAIVFPHRSPLPFRKIRPPALPVFLAQTRLFQSVIFDSLESGHRSELLRDTSAPNSRIFAPFLPAAGRAIVCFGRAVACFAKRLPCLRSWHRKFHFVGPRSALWPSCRPACPEDPKCPSPQGLPTFSNIYYEINNYPRDTLPRDRDSSIVAAVQRHIASRRHGLGVGTSPILMCSYRPTSGSPVVLICLCGQSLCFFLR